jgi:hypothetical protein
MNFLVDNILFFITHNVPQVYLVRDLTDKLT